MAGAAVGSVLVMCCAERCHRQLLRFMTRLATHDAAARERVLQARRERDVRNVRLAGGGTEIRIDGDEFGDGRSGGELSDRLEVLLDGKVLGRGQSKEARLSAAVSARGATEDSSYTRLEDISQRHVAARSEVCQRTELLCQDAFASAEVGKRCVEAIASQAVKRDVSRLELLDHNDAGVILRRAVSAQPAGHRSRE